MRKLLLIGFCLTLTLVCRAQEIDPDYDKGMIAYFGKKYADAVQPFHAAAKKGVIKANYMLALLFEDGLGVTASKDSAFYWYKKLAELGYPNAQNNVGAYYEHGWSVAQSYAEAAKWYQKAADQGNTTAQNNIAVLYRDGVGVPLDFEKSLHYAHLAAEQNNAKAKYNIGIYYMKGEGVPQSSTDAVAWWEKSANDGYTGAMNALGGYYIYVDDDTEKNKKKAFEWYYKSAKLGDEQGLYRVAQLYEEGYGTKQNDEIAANAYELAAKKGNKDAAAALKRLQDYYAAKHRNEPQVQRERQCFDVMCTDCYGSGKIHHSIVGGATVQDKYGNRGTIYGDYSTCFKCMGTGKTKKCVTTITKR